MRTLAILSLVVGLVAAGCSTTSSLGAEEPASSPPSRAQAPAHRVFVGPRFVTGAEPAEVRAVVVDEEGTIVSLHADPADAPPGERIELPGALAVPGLHDAHLHLMGVGRLAEQVDLVGAASPAEVVERVAAQATAYPDAKVLYGRGWDQSRFPGRAFPTAADLVPLGERPVVLTRVDGHAIWVNRAALELAGVDGDTEAPEGGAVHRDESGAPTGILVDNAMALVRDRLPAPTDEDRERWLAAGAAAAADAGLVAVHEMGLDPAALEPLRALDKAGRLPLRVFVYLDGSQDPAYPLLDELGAEQALGPQHPGPRPTGPPAGRVTVMGAKLFADGALGSRGAALREDYSDDEGNRGLLVTEPKILEERARRVHEAGGQVAIHAIGDRGIRTALEALDAAVGGGAGGDGRRHRIEHAQLMAPGLFERLHKQGLVASMQPTHATSDMRWAEDRVGPERIVYAYAWRRMLDEGIPLAFGSDAPVESHRPALGLYAALTRQDAEGKPEGGFYPGQRLSLSEALAAFSAGAAFAVHQGERLGRLAPGYAFDASLFAEDPRAEPAAWLDARPVGTVVGGVLHRRRSI